MDIKLSKHVKDRLQERTSLTIKELNEIYHDERIVPIGIEGKSKYHEILYSVYDKDFYVCVRDVNNSELITLLTLHQHRTCAWVVADDAKRMCKDLYKDIEGSSLSESSGEESTELDELDFYDIPSSPLRMPEDEIGPTIHHEKDHSYWINKNKNNNLPFFNKTSEDTIFMTFFPSLRADDKDYGKLCTRTSINKKIVEIFPTSIVKVHVFSIDNSNEEILVSDLKDFNYDIDLFKDKEIFSDDGILHKFLMENEKNKWILVRIRFGNSLEDHFYALNTKCRIEW